jgi:hypothetical protein
MKQKITEGQALMLVNFMDIREEANPFYSSGVRHTSFKASYAGYTTSSYTLSKALGELVANNQFGSSWAWLMPVVEKITGLYRQADYPEQVFLSCFGEYDYSEGKFVVSFNVRSACKGATLFDATLAAVLDFVQNYDSNIYYSLADILK